MPVAEFAGKKNPLWGHATRRRGVWKNQQPCVQECNSLLWLKLPKLVGLTITQVRTGTGGINIFVREKQNQEH